MSLYLTFIDCPANLEDYDAPLKATLVCTILGIMAFNLAIFPWKPLTINPEMITKKGSFILRILYYIVLPGAFVPIFMTMLLGLIAFHDVLVEYDEYCKWHIVELYIDAVDKDTTYNCYTNDCECGYKGTYDDCTDIVLNNTIEYCNADFICCSYNNNRECLYYDVGICDVKCDMTVDVVVSGHIILPFNNQMVHKDFSKTCYSESCVDSFVSDYGTVGSNYKYGVYGTVDSYEIGYPVTTFEIQTNVVPAEIILLISLIVQFLASISAVIVFFRHKKNPEEEESSDEQNTEIEMAVVESKKTEEDIPVCDAESVNVVVCDESQGAESPNMPTAQITT